jgi:hypothetical protein
MKKIVRLTESDLVRIVRRVISEDVTSNDTGVSGIMNQVINLLNGEITKIDTDPTKPQPKLKLVRKSQNDDVIYQFVLGNNTPVGDYISVNNLTSSGGAKVVGNAILQAFNINYNKSLPKMFTPNLVTKSGIVPVVNKWVQSWIQPTQN